MPRPNTRWSFWTPAPTVKEAVEKWASMADYHSINEIEGIVEGRLDALLIPLSIKCPMFVGMGALTSRYGDHYDWADRLGLAGVEVKVDKGDFQHGLNSGQFERYAKDLTGLYIAGPKDVVKPSLVPERYGVLTVSGDPQNGPRIVCRRHPQWQPKPLTPSQCWRILWRYRGDWQQEIRELNTNKDDYQRRFQEKAGQVLAAGVRKALKTENAQR